MSKKQSIATALMAVTALSGCTQPAAPPKQAIAAIPVAAPIQTMGLGADAMIRKNFAECAYDSVQPFTKEGVVSRLDVVTSLPLSNADSYQGRADIFLYEVSTIQSKKDGPFDQLNKVTIRITNEIDHIPATRAEWAHWDIAGIQGDSRQVTQDITFQVNDDGTGLLGSVGRIVNNGRQIEGTISKVNFRRNLGTAPDAFTRATPSYGHTGFVADTDSPRYQQIAACAFNVMQPYLSAQAGPRKITISRRHYPRSVSFREHIDGPTFRY